MNRFLNFTASRPFPVSHLSNSVSKPRIHLPRISSSPRPFNHFHHIPFRSLLQTVRTMSSSRLTGKTVLVTGASSGIGRSCALEFARAAPEGLRIIVTARRVEKLENLAQEITSYAPNVKVLPVQLDVADPKAVAGFVEGLPEEWRAIDVLVNNA